jgi:hypothetical protein
MYVPLLIAIASDFLTNLNDMPAILEPIVIEENQISCFGVSTVLYIICLGIILVDKKKAISSEEKLI